MNKLKKQVLKTGMDDNGAEYFFICPKCKSMNALNMTHCGHCGKKRPRSAYENAQVRQPKPQPLYGADIDRTARNAYPTAPTPCFAVPMPINGNYDPANYTGNTMAGLPVYYATDEYGRVYRAKVSYGALPCAHPVPVATPAKHIQTSSINVNLNQ